MEQILNNPQIPLKEIVNSEEYIQKVSWMNFLNSRLSSDSVLRWKHTWEWANKVSISSTLNAQIFHTNVVLSGYMYVEKTTFVRKIRAFNADEIDGRWFHKFVSPKSVFLNRWALKVFVWATKLFSFCWKL